VVNEGGSHRELQDQKVLPRAQFLMGDLTRSKELENKRI
jgi:hypothetical protein